MDNLETQANNGHMTQNEDTQKKNKNDTENTKY